jgi:hypothetical protein
MTLTSSTYTLAQYVVDKIKSNYTTPVVPGIPGAPGDVYYGDQDRIDAGVVICVEPNDKARTLNGVPRKTLVDIELYVLVYFGKLQALELNRAQADQTIDLLEKLLHLDPRMNQPAGGSADGLCIHSLVTKTESGFSNKNNTLIRTARLTFTIRTQELLPQ